MCSRPLTIPTATTLLLTLALGVQAQVITHAPLNTTAGLRNIGSPSAPTPVVSPGITSGAFAPQAVVFTSPKSGETALTRVFHQPLIQIKLRVVEVVREDSLQAGSVLDYISRIQGNSTLIDGNNVNNNWRNLTGLTRFPNPASLIGVNNTNPGTLNGGDGLIVNVTSGHINYIARLLAQEFDADLITSPQVVTMNGQNVEFTAGDKVPFSLGQNVLQDGTNAIQQFYYKPVGTYVSVTPRIVNWGAHAEGSGEREVVASDVKYWDRLIRFLLEERLLSGTPEEIEKMLLDWKPYARRGVLVPIGIQRQVLLELNKLSRAEIAQHIEFRQGQDPEYYYTIDRLFHPVIADPSSLGAPCEWKPSECTIDLEVIVRLSEKGMTTLSVTRGDATTDSQSASTEANLRAVANVIQLQSGHGAVMAGLMGEREIEEVAKVPVLGDIPVVGYAFRNKGTNRQKTEVLIFIEARVLDQRPEVARAESAEDFRFGNAYVAGDLLDNPLEVGMCRAGFGSYLPPRSHGECVYWERLGRKVRKAHTAIDDTFE